MMKIDKRKLPKSEEHKKKIGDAQRGISKPLHTEEWKKENSKRMIGNKHAKGTKHTLEWRKLMSQKLKGDKCYLWRGGINKINDTIRKSLEYKLWREAVFERDNYTCVWCGARSKTGVQVTLNADHIKQFAYYPELRFAIDNGRTLCVPCHKTTDTYLKGNITVT